MTKSISKIKIGEEFYDLIDVNAAREGHGHSIDDINGILPIAKGGTDATTAEAAVTNIVNGQLIKPRAINATSYIYTSEGNVYTNNGDVFTNEGNVRTLDGNVYTFKGNVYATTGNVYATKGDVYTYNGDVYTRSGDVYTRSGDVIVKSTDGATDLHKLSQKAEADHKHSASDITSGVLSVTRGGTGVTGFIPDAVPIGARVGTGIDFVEPANGAFFAPSANDIPRFGTLPIAQGGSGQSGLVSEYTVANVATDGPGCSVLSVQYHQWGKVAQLYIGIHCTSAKNSGDVLATIVSGKQPVVTTPLTNLANASQSCAVYANGQVQAKSLLAAGADVYVIGTYLLP